MSTRDLVSVVKEEHLEVRLEASTTEPWAVSAAVQILQDQARLIGLVDIMGVYITATVIMTGETTRSQINDLRQQLGLLGVESEVLVQHSKEYPGG